MSKIGRNDPCPCGSGKKYKKCHMRADEAGERVSEARSTAVFRVADWLNRRFPDAVDEAIVADFLYEYGEQGLEILAAASPGIAQMVQMNVDAWLVADARLYVGGDDDEVGVTAVELLGRPGAPPLSAAQRDWITALSNAPLRLYEIGEVRPGMGLALTDLLAADGDSAPEVFVRERAGSQALTRRAVLGCRLVPAGDELVVGGDIYLFSDTRAARRLARELVDELAKGMTAQECGIEIIWAWLETLFGSPAVTGRTPELVDRRTGDPLVLCTDRYVVVDRAALAAALEAEPDVVADPDDESGETGWLRLGGDPDADASDILLAINPGADDDRIETFARTQALADQGRAWLESVAGPHVRHELREIVDPKSQFEAALRSAKEGGGPTGRQARPAQGMSPAELTAAMQEIQERVYANWADEEIPALGGLTPRQAVQDESGRRDLIDLLKDYEAREAKQARHEGRAPTDMGYLWESVGLTPDA